MTFQQSVDFDMGAGVPGEIYDTGPRRVQPFIISSTDASQNVYGRGFSITAEGIAAAGNPSSNKVFAGILIEPKSAVSYGTTSGTLNPTLTVPNNKVGQFITEGSIFVELTNSSAAIGDLVIMDDTTGELTSISRVTPVPSGSSPVYAFVDRYTVGSNGLAVITLLPSVTYASA